jgi:[protein-PII] uridylyltransferase
MATLLHDIGKDTGGRAHGERGAELCRTILTRLGVQEHDIVEIQHLIRKHLRMYHVASRRDIDDPKTIEDFRGEVHGPEGLKELYLLTLCDVATTSPTALTTWKARMMGELYMSTLRSFDQLPSHSEERAENIRAATLALCKDEGDCTKVEQFLSSVPNRYLYANEPEQILLHAQMGIAAEGGDSVVDILGIRPPYVEVAFVTEDRPGTLAMITAALAANQLRVIGAQLYSWTDHNGEKRVLDIFWVRGGRDPEQVRRVLPRVRTDLQKLLSGDVPADELIEGRKSSRLSQRPSPNVPVTINFDNRSSSRYTVLEVLAEDQPALLYRLAKTLKQSGLEIAVAKINTEGNGVADVFYVADRDGKKLTDPAEVEHLSNRLRAALPKPAK